ncbi:peptide chain release factor N(5)-glutamine methyltransferase [Sulfuriferula nivalis]|uniref:Release factor glutamine methyltransferase n=1 Tax=Sulfuriferula nivalis TaxID=2675298 RepID=A0A809S3E9_9PROT|nr:peptide chain release factor N(5)-glutamine methyltransferase [Sulfuriferula nivalis]BBP01288.1 release factor glutamine methyltransferase [Sulfuriferula nivalis]
MQILGILQADSAKLALVLDMSIVDARFEVQLLMAQILQVNRAWLIAHDDEILSVSDFALYQQYLQRRLQGEPIAYIFGEKEFYGMTFKVTPDVLIPRPDTELLVELALLNIPEDKRLRVLDLGTGSGAIAISIANARPLTQVVAVDKSPAAIAVAQTNAALLGVINIDFVVSDWWQQLPEGNKFDLIVSNPPYIVENDDHLKKLHFEPISALTAGVTGLDDLRLIIDSAAHFMTAGGHILLEHGYDQADVVQGLLTTAGFKNVKSERDLGGVERVTLGQVG